MKWWGWLLCLLPTSLGWVFGLLASNGMVANPTLYLRGGLAAVTFRGGLTLSVIALAVGLITSRVQRRHQSALEKGEQRALEERRLFIQRLDHELKNPLTAILTGLNNLADVASDDYLRDEIHAVQAQARRITHLVTDLRKLAALETVPVERTPVDLAELLEGEVQTVRESTGRSINLMLPSAPWPLPAVRGDPDLLLLSLHNLLENAIKFTKSGDTVEVHAFEDDRQVVVEVADTGPGIPIEEVDHVWEELYRGKGARGVEGSGLGLALVKLIVERHGGEVGLRSQAGRGTVFSVRLPI